MAALDNYCARHRNIPDDVDPQCYLLGRDAVLRDTVQDIF